MDKGDESDMTIPSISAPASRSAADRMRAHRERRRLGLRCLTVQLRETEIDVLVRKGLLPPETRNDARAITEAVHRHFDQTLASTP
jgi:hypothetical protein